MEPSVQGNDKSNNDLDGVQSKAHKGLNTEEKPTEVVGNSDISKNSSLILGQEIVDSLPQASQIEADIKCIMLINSVEDTSQNSKIQKYLLEDSSILTIKELGEQNIKMVALYGISSVMKKFIKAFFGQKVPKLPKAEGVYLYYRQEELKSTAKNNSGNDKQKIIRGIIAFNTPNENQYMGNLNACPKRFVTIVRILSDLCFNIVACISEEMIQNWYYEQEGKMNPFKPKTHQSQTSRMEDIIITESKIEEIKSINSILQSIEYMLHKDGNAPIYAFDFKVVSADEEKMINDALKEFPITSLRVESADVFELNADKLLELIKFGEFNRCEVRNKLKKIFVNLLNKKEQILREFIQRTNEILLRNLKPRSFEYSMSACADGMQALTIKPESTESENLLKKNYNLYKESIKSQENEFVQKCESILTPLKSDVAFSQLSIYKREYRVSGENTEQTCKFEDSKHLFNKSVSFKNFLASQIISLDSEAIFILIKNLDKNETFVLRFKSEILNQGDYEICESIQDLDAKLAWGSTASKYILFENTKKRASQGSLRLNKYFQKGTELDVYSVVESVACAYYLNVKREILIIDSHGFLYRLDTVYEKSTVQIVKHPGTLDKLTPLKGKKFLNIDASKDENALFLMNEVSIEFYNKNFELTNSIDLSQDFLAFKIVDLDYQCFLLIQNKKSQIQCFKITSPQRKSVFTNQSNQQVEVKGNPIFDIHHQGFIKFGPIVEETQIIKKVRNLGYFTLSGEKRQIQNYIIGLSSIKTSFNKPSFVTPSKIFKELKKIKVSEFYFALCTRIPLQVAALQNSKLVPLKDGINNYEEIFNIEGTKLMDNLNEYIKFGHYEDIINGLKGIMVISIIGKQSSGKSYLLNRLAGTRFDVAAERCTQGIWMGFGKMEDTPIIVFDCEGLFTIERTNKEEIQLCLFISSLSDITILNSDLASGKHIKALFDEFSEGVGKLRGSNLFGGYLDIAYRDIPNNQEDGVDIEFSNFLRNLVETGKKDTLSRLFNLKVLNSKYHHFEIDEFNHEVEKRRNEYFEMVNTKWICGKRFSSIMKAVLAQLYLDKTSHVDIIFFNSKLKELKENIELMIAKPGGLKEFINPEVYKSTINLGSKAIEINWPINGLLIKDSDIFKFFKVSIFLPKHKGFLRKFHNRIYAELKKNIDKFFEHRNSLILNYFTGNLPPYEEFRNEVDVQGDIQKIETKLDELSKGFRICLRSCEKCGFCCLKISNHEGAHDCGTDHKCDKICSICKNGFVCNLPNEHKDFHLCDKQDHKCIRKCNIKNCKNTCELSLYHENECKCKSSHDCLKNCGMYSMCNKKCNISSAVDHDRHSCDGKCMFRCIFEDGNNCSSLDHFHDKGLVYENSNLLRKIKRHLCGTVHKCKGICGSQGYCEVSREESMKAYKNRFISFIYPYVKITANKLKCIEDIPAGEIGHKNPSHICTSKTHFCLFTCPECLSPCSKAFGHSGPHSSDYHTNKNNSIYISKQETFKFIEEIKRQELTLVSGESAIIETCTDYCAKKGHGHTHPIPCRDKNQCFQKKIPGHAIHSETAFRTNNGQVVVDLVSCSEYWKYYNWEQPCSKTPQMLEIFRKCNFYCIHPSHSQVLPKVYCEGNLFHSSSLKPRDHQFRCNHPGNDIVFISDCTGSMNPHFANVKKLITDLISKWGNEKTKFAFVGYLDHAPHNGSFPAEKPVFVYPSSKNLNDGNAAGVSTFLNEVNTHAEGSNHGEAMIDGLNEASKLNFQEGSYKTFILFADENPHGREFNSSSGFADGCPCGHDWREVLRNMKGQNVEFILVKLSDMLNKTLELFGNEYKNNFRSLSMNEVSALDLECIAKVRKDEEDYFVISKVQD